MKYLILISSLFFFVNAVNAGEHTIEISFGLETTITTPDEATSKAAAAAYDRLSQIQASDRTASQEELWDVLDYFAQELSQNPDSKIALEQLDKLNRAISPKANSANTIVTRKTPGTVSVKSIGKRLSALRKQVSINRFTSSTLSKPKKGRVFGIPSGMIKYNNPLDEGGLFDQRLSGFVSGGATISKQSETGTEIGFQGDLQQLTFGADYRVTNKSFAGAAISLSTGSVELDSDNGKLDNSSQTFLFYGTHSLQPNWYVDATVSIGNRSFELERKIDFTFGSTITSSTANSSPDSAFSGLSIGTGYEKSWNNGHNVSIFGSIDYTESTIDAFQEKDAGGFNLAVGKQMLVSTQLLAGVEWRQAISTRFGVILPQLSMSWVQELETSSDTINSYFIADPNKTSIEYKTGNKDLGYLNLKLGASMIMPRGISLFAQYETQQFVDDYQQYTVSLGGRKEF